jgi:hypothetical protein
MAEERGDPEAQGPLQFERAEYAEAPAPPSCHVCGEPVHGVYYDVNGATTCERCRHDLELAGTGHGAGRLARATLLGVLAAVACSIAWYAIRKLTGYEFGILAIGVGLLVGGAVRSGSRGRGGWRYQVLAMFLTYNAIVVTYVPDIVQGLQSAQTAPAAAPSASPSPALPVAAPPPAAPATPRDAPEGAPTAGMVALALGVLLLFAYAAPFLAVAGEPSAVLGLVIIGIALYEAWKMNRRRVLEITGPHRLASPRAVPPGADDGA